MLRLLVLRRDAARVAAGCRAQGERRLPDDRAPRRGPRRAARLALRDLDIAIGLDADGDGAITWGELRARHARPAALRARRASASRPAGERCPLNVAAHEVDRHTDGAYAVLGSQVVVRARRR